jgi:hypothetical protein
VEAVGRLAYDAGLAVPVEEAAEPNGPAVHIYDQHAEVTLGRGSIRMLMRPARRPAGCPVQAGVPTVQRARRAPSCSLNPDLVRAGVWPHWAIRARATTHHEAPIVAPP